MESFTLAVPFRSGRVEFLRCGDGTKTHERTLAVWTNTRLERKCIAGLFGHLGFSSDQGLLIIVYNLPFMLI